MLRRAHAHHRDLPSRAETDVARATKGAGSMTDRLSQIINQYRLHRAGPAQAICADQLSARPQTTNPPIPASTARRHGWKAHVCSPVKLQKRSAATAVASTGSALSP